jgi:hypothetical protein
MLMPDQSLGTVHTDAAERTTSGTAATWRLPATRAQISYLSFDDEASQMQKTRNR